jgi:SPP1 gp7 family putative phage head morphogenesis protein
MYKPYAEQAVRLETSQLEKELGKLISWEVTDPLIEQYVNMRSADLVAINTHTFEVARDVVDSLTQVAFDKGWTSADLAREIKSGIQQVYNVRVGQPIEPNGLFDLGGMSSSRTIARTEMGSVSSKARFDAFRTEGIEKHQWITFRDDRTRESHRAVDRQVVDIGVPFANGLRYPRDAGGSAGEVINCRCTVVPVFD